MSKKGSTPDKGEPKGEPTPDLSALDFGPAWARPDQGSKSRPAGKAKPHSGTPSRPSAPSRGRQAGHPGQRRGGPAGRQDRDGESGGDRRGGHPKGRGRKDFVKGGRERKQVPLPEGVSARIMPIEEGLDAMAKQISATGRTHSVFDLAWLVLGALERFHVIFESDDEPLYRSESDHSVWQGKKECMAHFWSSGLIHRYYDEEITQVDPPSGNFQSVARCGFSKQLIGPPNHHGYQQALLDLHRERFSNMPLERYKSKIIMEHGEEVVQEWLDAMCQRKRWRPKAEQTESEPVQEELEEAQAPVEEQAEEQVQQVEEPVLEAEAMDAGQSDDAVAQQEEQAVKSEPASAVPAGEETVVILDNHREVEQHFFSHGFDQEFYEGKTVSALANIPPRMISPALMSLLRHTVGEEKRYPGNLASILCRQMSGRHLAVFKWKKRLHCGPARPRHVPDDLLMADRPAKLFHWVTEHPGGNIDKLWQDCLPADIDDATRHTWYHDLHWLINEGFVLLFSDGTLHAAKELGGTQSAEPKAGGKKKTPSQQSSGSENSSSQQAQADLGTEPKTSAGDEPDQQEAQEEQ